MVGDVNCRFGKSVRDLLASSELPNSESYSYPHVSDDVVIPNDNARVLSSLCSDNGLLVINNLQTNRKYFPSKKTYKKAGQWLSELDAAVVSCQLVECIETFAVHQTDWLPSDHAPISLCMTLPNLNFDSLIVRAGHLGGHASLQGQFVQAAMVNKPLNFVSTDMDSFAALISNRPLPVGNDDVNSFAHDVSETLYTCASMCTVNNIGNSDRVRGVGGGDRWERLLQDKDDSRVWRAINWKGILHDSEGNNISPSDQEFKDFYINNFSGEDHAHGSLDTTTNVNIPILDDPISCEEVNTQIKNMKPNKACGPDGVPPGIFRSLPAHWLVLITNFFNLIFSCAVYPGSWANAKLVMIFKKGNRKDPKNYRGISIINSIAKLYDSVLCARLNQWFKPFREQAGAQRGRGCVEHIVTLRLLTDLAKKKKKKLYITFIDFSQAYDRVPRRVLFSVLKRLGCGAVMLGAIVAMYNITNSIIGTALIVTTIGVRQGSPTSCLFFIIYVNDMIKMVKESCEADGFLSWLHILVLMDDTVLLSTSRANMLKKLSLVCQFCNTYGMKINETKTKFMVICGSDADRVPMVMEGLVVSHCDRYTYLGSPFMADGSVSAAVRAHAHDKMAHFNKFVSFLQKNNDVPFIVKKRVFDAVVLSALLYGSESWLGADLKPIVKLYNWSLKQMLGVRGVTCNDLCHIESGCPPLPALVKARQRKFFGNMYAERSGMDDDPLGFALRLVLETRYNTKTYVSDLINNNADDCTEAMNMLRSNAMQSTSSRRITYINVMNPNLKLLPIYTERHNVNELHRIAFTRFRVSAHTLAIEAGRWNRRGRGRLPVEERLCMCGNIQTEEHVVSECPLSIEIRNVYNIRTIHDLFSGTMRDDDVCAAIYRLLQLYA